MDSKGITPRYAFGFGLSYTTFAYSSLSITAATPSSLTSTAYTVTFNVKNSGAVAGTEIPQLYLGYPSGSGEPQMVLRGFDEVKDLGVGQSKTVTVSLTLREIRCAFYAFLVKRIHR